ncbi:hypothetical protein O9929_03740 [Vibrio lentus]|nr:hypothetical protein [Vibrio lentus]
MLGVGVAGLFRLSLRLAFKKMLNFTLLINANANLGCYRVSHSS